MGYLSNEEKDTIRELVEIEVETLEYYDRLGDLDISGRAYDFEYMQLINKIRTNHELGSSVYNYFIRKGMTSEIRDYLKLVIKDMVDEDLGLREIVDVRINNYIYTSFLEYKDEDTGVIERKDWDNMLDDVLSNVMDCDIELIYVEELLRFGRQGYNNFVKKAYWRIYQKPLVEVNLLFRNFNFDIFREINFYDCGEMIDASNDDYESVADAVIVDMETDLSFAFNDRRRLDYLEKEELFCKLMGYYRVLGVETRGDLNTIIDRLQIVRDNTKVFYYLNESFGHYYKNKGRYK